MFEMLQRPIESTEYRLIAATLIESILHNGVTL